MSCGLEFLAGFLIGSNRRCSSVMETQLTIQHRSINNWNLRMVWDSVGYKVSWSKCVSCQLCIWSYEVLKVDVNNFIKKLLRKRTLIIAKAIPWIPEHAFLSSISFYFRLSLVEYFCTQGSLTLVAGEAHEQICLDRAAWRLFLVMTICKCVTLGQGSFNCVFCNTL